MPNNNFDDILKGKLSGFEAGYNPADWRRMEAMLPKDSRKFFWLIAFLFSFLLIGTAGLMFVNIFNSNLAHHNHTAGKSGVRQIASSPSNRSCPSHPPSQSRHASAKGDIGNSLAICPTPGKSVSAFSQIHDSAKLQDKTQNELEPGYGGEIIYAEKLHDEKSQLSNSAQGNHRENSEVENEQLNFDDRSIADEKSKKSNSKNANENVADQTLKKMPESRNMERNASLLPNSGSTPLSHPMTGSHRMTMTAQESAEMLARLNADMIDNELSDETLLPTLEAIPLSKKSNRQIFEFALGAGAGPDFSWLGANRLMKPGYSFGIIQEFMFINRIGLALSQSYVHRRYNGGQYPCPDISNYNCPLSYSSEVKSMDFGIDVKANLIHKARWDWFVKAGVINTVKLKETFDFQFPRIDTIPNPPQPTLVTNNNFSSVVANESFDQSSSGFSRDGGGQPNLTISGANRFHLAWHFATGVDVRLNSKMKLQFETGYSFTKPTIGVNESRLQSFGINGRMFFLFGK